MVIFKPSESAMAETTANNNNEQRSVTSLDSLQAETGISYIDVFQEYYLQVSDRLASGGIEMPYSFDEFCSGYYKSDMGIQEYADTMVCEAYGINNISEYEIELMSSSDDEKYILKGGISDPDSSSFDPYTTPASAFRRVAKYGKFDYSAIHEGDILFESATIGNNVGHTALVYDVNKPGSASMIDDSTNSNRSTYIQTIEAVAGGVQFGFLDDTRMVDFGVVVLRATNDLSAIEHAKYFTWCQLDKPYRLPIDDSTQHDMDIDSPYWFCSELNYAAYLDAGIDLHAIGSDGWCWPYDLLLSNYLDYVNVSDCLDARLLSKDGDTWQFRIYNTSNSSITLYYNTKLAFEGDARNWTGLKDITSKTINAGSSTIVNVSKNVLADTATFSHIKNGKRYITYCGDLFEGLQMRMWIKHNIVAA